MEHNPGDSSSESDISDPWSIVDRDSCEPDDLPGDSTVRDRDSVSGEPSDGESLEVIDEEEKHEDEYKDADMETDGISIISESEINDELEHPLSLTVSKEKKYLHHPNTYLNTRLNVLLAISFAAVTGLGLGHFLGLQEECPLPNESVSSQLMKLQQDNELLRAEFAKLLCEKNAASNAIEDWECGASIKFKNEGIAHLHPSSQESIVKQIQRWNYDIPSNTPREGNVAGPEDKADNENKYKGKVENNLELSSDDSEGSVSFGKTLEYLIPANQKDEIVEKQFTKEIVRSVPFDRNSEYLMVAERKEELGVMSITDEDFIVDSVADYVDHVDDVTFVQFRDHVDVTKPFVELDNDDNGIESSTIDIERRIVTKNEKNTAESSRIDMQIVWPIEPEKEMFAYSVVEENTYLDDRSNMHPSEDETVPKPHKDNKAFKGRESTGNFQPEIMQDTTKDTRTWDESNMEIIKSTLHLLSAQINDDIVSPDTGDILSSAVALTTELEESQFYLQDVIAHCEVQKSSTCVQFGKKTEVSIIKLKETLEGLADDIDEQMYKLLNRILRKLKKFKGNLQDKWCHLTTKYDRENDAIYNWLHSAVLLECKERGRQNKRKLHLKSSKESGKSYEAIVSGTVQEKIDVPDEEFANLKSVERNIASETSHQIIDDGQTVPKTGVRPDDKHMSDKVILNHDSLNEPPLELNTPVIVRDTSGKPEVEERYLAEFYKDWKHDKNHVGMKERKKQEKKYKNVLQSKTCWQTHHGKTVCQKLKNDPQFSHKLKEQFVKKGRGDNHWYEKRNWKNQFDTKERKEYKKQERNLVWQDENKHPKQSVILDQGASWALVDASTPKQTNISGDWMLKMANSRAEQRKLEHRSDWLFDRAGARKVKREMHHMTGNWYFQRARGREYCRYYPNSDWCKAGNYNGPNYDRFRQNEYDKENNENGKLRHAPRWFKKFVPRSFATAGKWMKDSFSNFQNKINYHSHR